MSYDELNEYFETAILPETMRIDRATTQYNVAKYVKQDLEMLKQQPNDTGSKHRLLQIKNGLENPYKGRRGLLPYSDDVVAWWIALPCLTLIQAGITPKTNLSY